MSCKLRCKLYLVIFPKLGHPTPIYNIHPHNTNDPSMGTTRLYPPPALNFGILVNTFLRLWGGTTASIPETGHVCVLSPILKLQLLGFRAVGSEY